MTTTVLVRKKGQFTIPAAMREKLGIEDNTVVSISLLESGTLIIVPKKLKLTAILDKTADYAKKKGITLEEMLTELDEIRHNS